MGYDGEQDVWDHGHKRVVEDDKIDALLDDALSDSSNMPIIDDYIGMAYNNNSLHGQGRNSKKIKLCSP